MALTYTTAVAASRGRRRYQEDTGIVWTASGEPSDPPSASAGAWSTEIAPLEDGAVLAVLADGMGGHVGGATASRLASETFIASFAGTHDALPLRHLQALEASNTALAARMRERPALSGMGTTLIGAYLGSDGLSWISVGDSLLYLWRRGELARLNEDHSFAPELDKMAAAGRMSVEDALSDRRRHYLRSAVTGEEIELIDVSARGLELADGDVVLLASDGIDTLADVEISQIVLAGTDQAPADVAKALIAAVDDVGDHHQDNTTVIVIKVAAAVAAGIEPLSSSP